MKFVTKNYQIIHHEDGTATIVFDINDFKTVENLSFLEKNPKVSVEIDKVYPKRTAEQNKLMWRLIKDIVFARTGRNSSKDEWKLYVQSIKKCGPKYDTIVVDGELSPELLEKYRYVKKVGERVPDEEDGVMKTVYNVYYGSSDLNTKEMGQLIDYLMDLASEEGVDLDYYYEALDKKKNGEINNF